MKSSDLGGKAAQRSPSCGASGALSRLGARWSPRPGVRPGLARSGPPPAEAAGRGRGRSTWGATQPRSPESTELGSATAAARQRERSAASGSGQRSPRCSPGLGESANIFQTSQTFLLSPLSGVSLGWNCSPDSRGAPGRDSSPGFLGGSANFAGPGPRGSYPSAEPSPRCSPAREGRDRGSFASGRTPSPAPLHPPQDWRQRINQRGARASPPPLRGGASPGRGNDKFTSRRWPVGSKHRRQRRGVPVSQDPEQGALGTRGGSAVGLLGPGRWLLRRARGGTRGRASAPCVPTRAAAPEEKPESPPPPPPPPPPPQSAGLRRRCRPLRRLSGKAKTQGAPRGPGGCAPRRLLGCAASRG